MKRDSREFGTNLLVIGIVVFFIGIYSEHITNWVHERSDIYISGWGWILQFAGGLLAIYGFMIHLEVYLATTRPPPQPGMPQLPPSPPLFIMDRETKKVIWLLMIAALVMFILSPALPCQTILIILLALVIIFLILRGSQHPYYAYQQPYYPPQTPYQPPSVEPSPPPQSSKVKLCAHCHAQLELDWVVCPFCGQSTANKS